MSNSSTSSDWDDNLLLVVPDAHVGVEELDAELFMMGDVVDVDVDVDEQEDEPEEDKPDPFFNLPMLLIVGPFMGDGI